MTCNLIGLYSSAPGAGKSTVAYFLGGQYETCSFASPIKSLMEQFLYMMELDGNYWIKKQKDERISPLGVSARHLCQTFGTEWGRNCVHPDIWVMMAESRVDEHLTRGKKIVFDDVRFPNEAEMILRRGGELWRVDRPGNVYDGDHSSEGALAAFNPHRVISNDGGLGDLLQLSQQ